MAPAEGPILPPQPLTGQAILDGPGKPAQFFLGVGGLMFQRGDPVLFLLGVVRPALQKRPKHFSSRPSARSRVSTCSTTRVSNSAMGIVRPLAAGLALPGGGAAGRSGGSAARGPLRAPSDRQSASGARVRPDSQRSADAQRAVPVADPGQSEDQAHRFDMDWIAAANDCVVVTDNERDFAGIEIINPIRPQPGSRKAPELCLASL